MATYTPENWYVSNITCKMKTKISFQNRPNTSKKISLVFENCVSRILYFYQKQLQEFSSHRFCMNIRDLCALGQQQVHSVLYLTCSQQTSQMKYSTSVKQQKQIQETHTSIFAIYTNFHFSKVLKEWKAIFADQPSSSLLKCDLGIKNVK